VKVAQKHYPIAFKFITLKGGIKAHPNAKFGCNTIKFNGRKVINNYLQKNNTNMLSHLQGKPLMARS